MRRCACDCSIGMKKKTVQEWDEIEKRLLGDFYDTSEKRTNVCSSDKVHALLLDVVESYTKPMKW